MNDKAIAQAVSAFGKVATARLSNPVTTGEPEDQLRGPFENLVLGLLVELEPQAAALLERICAGPLISDADLQGEGVFFPEGHLPATSPAQQSFDL